MSDQRKGRGMPVQKKRIDEIDVIKAIGIILMVVGHAEAPMKQFLYLFHMAIFFIASGFFFKPSSSDSHKAVAKTLLKKLRQLWVPYVVWNTIYTLLSNLFLRCNIYTDNPALLQYISGNHVTLHESMPVASMIQNILKGLLFLGNTEMGGAFWFLKILFLVSVSYCFAAYLIKRLFTSHHLLLQGLLSLVLLLAGFGCHLMNLGLFGFAQTFSYYWLYYAGHLFFLANHRHSLWNGRQYLPIAAISFGVLLLLNTQGEIALDQNSYVNPLFFLLASLAGWCLLYSIAYFVVRSVLKAPLIFIGQRTLSIVILHFLSFKLVAAFVVWFYGLPGFCLASFPCLYGSRGLWWVAYTIVGTGLPVLLDYLYHTCIARLQQPRIGKTSMGQ